MSQMFKLPLEQEERDHQQPHLHRRAIHAADDHPDVPPNANPSRGSRTTNSSHPNLWSDVFPLFKKPSRPSDPSVDGHEQLESLQAAFPPMAIPSNQSSPNDPSSLSHHVTDPKRRPRRTAAVLGDRKRQQVLASFELTSGDHSSDPEVIFTGENIQKTKKRESKRESKGKAVSPAPTTSTQEIANPPSPRPLHTVPLSLGVRGTMMASGVEKPHPFFSKRIHDAAPLSSCGSTALPVKNEATASFPPRVVPGLKPSISNLGSRTKYRALLDAAWPGLGESHVRPPIEFEVGRAREIGGPSLQSTVDIFFGKGQGEDSDEGLLSSDLSKKGKQRRLDENESCGKSLSEAGFLRPRPYPLTDVSDGSECRIEKGTVPTTLASCLSENEYFKPTPDASLALPDCLARLYTAAHTPSVSHRSPRNGKSTEEELWVDRWRPQRAREVLGNQNEVLFLRDWLSKLQVTAAAPVRELGRAKASQRAQVKRRHARRNAGRPLDPRKRRKLKRQEWEPTDDDEEDDGLANFIVDDDDQDLWLEQFRPQSPSHDQGEGSASFKSTPDAESASGPLFSPSPAPSTLSATSTEKLDFAGERLANCMILEGPSGSGKTASVYACAAELGFEVFELYPGMGRRSGKDLTGAVGDLGRNHMVSSGGMGGGATRRPAFGLKEKGPSGNPETPSVVQGDSQRDDAGKSSQKQDGGCDMAPSEEAPLPTSTVRQSLILIEEADILYEEDKNFWGAVIDLVSDSKRPVILTCNDKDLIPVQDLPVQRLLRFSPPEVGLTTTYLQLLAFAHGHLLDREVLQRLYTSTSPPALGCSFEIPADGPLHPSRAPGTLQGASQGVNFCVPDMRKAINQLQFWCQGRIQDTQRLGHDSGTGFTTGRLGADSNASEEHVWSKRMLEESQWSCDQVEGTLAEVGVTERFGHQAVSMLSQMGQDAAPPRDRMLRAAQLSDAFSFCDANLRRPFDRFLEMFEPDEMDGDANSLQTQDFRPLFKQAYHPGQVALPSYGREEELTEALLSAAVSAAQETASGGPSQPEAKHEDHHASSFLASLCDRLEASRDYQTLLSPLFIDPRCRVPRNAAAVDYAPFVRAMVRVDDAEQASHEAALERAMAEAAESLQVPGTTIRSTRNSSRFLTFSAARNGEYARWLPMGPDERHACHRTSLA